MQENQRKPLDGLLIMDKTCRTCRHCERWHYDSVIINYCTVTHSNRTQNGMMKVKATQAACGKYEKD